MIGYLTRKVLYPRSPSRADGGVNPHDWNMPFEELRLSTSDKVLVQAWLIPPRHGKRAGTEIALNSQVEAEDYNPSYPTVIFFHGNGFQIGECLGMAAMLHKRDCNIMLLSYRGYSQSAGSPCETGIRKDSQAALDYIKAHPVLSRSQLVLYGQSLGGAVAIDLASRNTENIAGLILENSFTSVAEVAETLHPVFKRILYFCSERWNSETSIAKLDFSTHCLLLSGRRDQLIPPAHMDRLWKVVRTQTTENRKFVKFPHGSHNDTCHQPGYWDKVFAFLDNIVPLDTSGIDPSDER